MEDVDLLLHPGWVVPMEPAGAVFEDHSVAVRDGALVALLPRPEAERHYRPARVRELPGQALMPGLVNAHTHAAMALLRGYADDLPLMTWLTEHIWPAEQAHVSEAFVRDGTELAVVEMLRGGVTCFNDMYYFPETVAEVASHAGMRVTVGMIVLDFPTVYADGPDGYLERGRALHADWRDHPLVDTVLAPHAPYTVGEASLERVRILADDLDRRVHIHLHETAGEVADSVREHGDRPLARLDALGLLGPRLLAVHMTQLTGDERARLAESGAHVVHCPEANLKLASGLCPVTDLLARGVNVALGTDGAASNNDLNLFGELRSAALVAKAESGDAGALPAWQALHLATLGGARALGRDHEIGSLLPGKAADMIAVDLSGPEAQPLHNVVSQLAYATGRSQVTDVWIAGRPVLADRLPQTLDMPALLERVRRWRDTISA
ncbi:TRZ/ATZ family hydrolase [Sediminicurvatus halobius]|uniref:TRZ/ATZ family hydrolase n=1 Tax=Sediminicurvatus halobius TaxID=2182432 RepID=A0A2U2N3D5_9GAMM|nr:TRZ/ATZ family hydrolase [Spiribacter halobius]PWG63479.1 TRZ/ATZ family hydrolase [Spiribacter halobius]UEX79651.1 TRZ/ATZ family hydrolase [Spiribacter halobius]